MSKAIKADAVEILPAEAEPEIVEAADEIIETMCIDDMDDNGHSNDGIDIDMSDIIVIDEYDSTKKERKSKKKVGDHN